MRTKSILIFLVFCFCLISSSNLNAQGLEKSVALLDMTARRGESDSKRFSLEHALKVAGMPYQVTEAVDVAVRHAVVVASSDVVGSTFLSEEATMLTDYVARGGTLVVPGIATRTFHKLFGISGYKNANTRHSLTWKTASLDPALRWFDDPNETTISLGRSTYVHVITTKGYTLNGAVPLAYFEDGSAAVTKSSYGKGYAYGLGFSFKDLILRNQINQDFNAQRTYSNGFEPTSDTIFLFLRAVFQTSVPFATWKHTSPSESKAVLMITHDVDSTSSMDMMAQFARLETERGIRATYNITTRYTADALCGAFYTPNILKVKDLLRAGHELGSHSVGHFPDFDNRLAFPEGHPGNTRETYQPRNDGDQTVGGSVYGELEVSRKLLEKDTGAAVRTFRTGYLLWNKAQVKVLDELGYKYDSSRSANDVLTNFPYICRYNNTFSGTISNVYEIPMTISDAKKSDKLSIDNYPAKVEAWLDIIRRNANNFAPTVLLIHPNRDFKIAAEDRLIQQLPDAISVLPMRSFGDFWAMRDKLRYTTEIVGDVLFVTIGNQSLPVDPGLSIVVDGGGKLSDIIVRTEDGSQLPFRSASWPGSSVLLHSFGNVP